MKERLTEEKTMTKQRQRELIDKAFESGHLTMVWDGITTHYNDLINRQEDAYRSLEIICICAERFIKYE